MIKILVYVRGFDNHSKRECTSFFYNDKVPKVGQFLDLPSIPFSELSEEEISFWQDKRIKHITDFDINDKQGYPILEAEPPNLGRPGWILIP